MMSDILEIANKIKNAGGNLYLVGGAVRDKLLGQESHDEDYCVTGIDSAQFQRIFPESKIRGKFFEVFYIGDKEFALARKEKKTGEGHTEFEITIGKQITIEEDLARRDITINSIAQEVLSGKIIDPFHGRQDLKNKIIRATTEAFKEDPLRVYRVARFAASLNFKVEENTIRLMHILKEELKTLSKERVFEEFRKALRTQKPSIFFDVLKEADVLDIHFKEIQKLIGALQPEEHHPEGDTFVHTMMVLDYASNMSDDLEVRFSALVHDLGKGLTPKEEYPHHYHHEIMGIELVENLGNRIGVPNLWIKSGKVACREHMRGGIFYKMKPSKKVDFIERVSKTHLGLKGLQIVVNSDKLSSRNVDSGSINFEEIGTRCLKEINGEYIKAKYHISEGVQLRNKLREERINWIK